MKVVNTMEIKRPEARIVTSDQKMSGSSRCRLKGRFLSASLAALAVAFVMAIPSRLLATDYYVSDTAGDDNYVGTLEAPFKTIAKALTAASAADTIFVDDGMYLQTVELVMDKALTLRSINGRDAVTIQQTVNNNRAVSITAAGAVLSGITVKAASWAPGSNQSINGLGVSVTAAATVTNCVMTGATGGGQNKSVWGGGIYMSAAGLITDCVISNNVMSGAWGAGVAITAGTLDRCLVTGNLAGSQHGGGAGCGVYIYGASAIVQNCLIVKNTSNYYNGAGVWLRNGTLVNCTIADNSGPAAGAGLFQTGGTALNLIVYGNSPNDVLADGGTLTYSCASGLMTGTGNRFMSPSFVNAAAGDYRLTAGSPCIDAGLEAGAPAYDFVAGVRPTDGDGDGTAKTDMGCYEYTIPASGPWCRFDASPTTGLNTLDTSFTALAKRDGAPMSGESYAWNFGDSGTSSVQNPSHKYSAPGEYTVELTVTDAFGSVTLTRTKLVRVVTADTYVSATGASIFPYGSWANAATNVQDGRFAATLAAQAGASPATLQLTNEVYNLNGELALDTGIVVIGAGRDVTSLRQNVQLSRCVRMSHAGAVLQDLTVTNGKYDSSREVGGMNGLGVSMSAGLITNCIAEGNSGGGQNFKVQGGGVYMSGGLMVDSVLRNNSGGMNGNGLYMAGGTADRCVITRNSGGANNQSDGGIGVSLNGAATLQNSLVVSNTSSFKGGAGVRMAHSSAVIQNCTIVDNTSAVGAEAGAGLVMTVGTLRNSIVYGNKKAGIADDLAKSGGTVEYSCISTSVSGTGNIIDSPAFVDSSNGDFHLTGSSPCVDTGMEIVAITRDLDHVARPADGNLSGTAETDMGCYEFTIPVVPLLCSFDFDGAASGLDTAEVVFTSSVLAEGLPADTNNVTYAWNFGDGESASGLGLYNPTHTYLTKGVYTVSLQVTFGGDTASFSREDCVKVYGPTVYVAMPGVGGAVFPFDTSAKAATNMTPARLAAVGAADSGAVRVNMIVDDGVYSLDSELLLDRPITLRSVNGPAVTTLQPSGITRVLNITDTNVVVTGFTVANGKLNSSANGAGIQMTGGVVTNCIITDNRAGGHGIVCLGGGIWMSGGLVVDCIIRNSKGLGNSDYHLGSAIYMRGGVLDRCVVTNNFGGEMNFGGLGGAGIRMDDRTTIVRNCLIAHNTTSYRPGGGVYVVAGTIENCTIVDNESNFENSGGAAGGGIWLNSVDSIARNLIVSGNRTAGVANDVYIAVGSVTYSCAPELTSGVGNITTPPRFKDFANGNFHVTGGPTADAGTNLAWIVSTTLDLDHEQRKVGNKVDMGCYEWQYRGTVLVVR